MKTDISVKNGRVIFSFPESPACKEVTLSIAGIGIMLQNGTMNQQTGKIDNVTPEGQPVPFLVTCGTIQVSPQGWTKEEFEALIWPE